MFTREFLANKMIQIALSMPESMNPMDRARSCLYTDIEDPSRHCFIGQLLVELDLPVPPPSRVAGFSTVVLGNEAYEPLKPFAKELDIIQRKADNHSNPRMWGSEEMTEAIYSFARGELTPY